MTAIIFFFVVSMINVILQTSRHILTTKGTLLTACIINAITFGFYAIIVKQISEFDMWISVIVTTVANFIGVYVTLRLMNKVKKDTLWKISVITINNLTQYFIIKELDKNNIAYRTYDIIRNGTKQFGMDIYSEKQIDSQIVKKILDEKDLRYCVTETNNRL